MGEAVLVHNGLLVGHGVGAVAQAHADVAGHDDGGVIVAAAAAEGDEVAVDAGGDDLSGKDDYEGTDGVQNLGDVNGHIEEMYGGHQVVKAFNGEEKSVEQFEQYNESLYTSAWKSQFFGSLMMPISNFIGNIGYVGVCIIGGILAGSKTITIGDIQAFIQYVRQFNQPISQIAQAANLLQSTGAAAERVFEFLEEEELTEDSATLTTEEVQNMKGAVTFADVHFGYNPDKIIINDFSLHVHAGQKVAIVGPTGAGKTTIIKLLMRFYELNGGSIMIDGEDITQMKRSDLRSLFGMVLLKIWSIRCH